MNILRTRYSHDLLNILFYIIGSIILGLIFCQFVTEGYIQLLALTFFSIVSGLITLIFVIILKLFSRRFPFLELTFGFIQLLIFELAYFVAGPPSLFGLLDSESIGLENGNFAMSISSLISIILIYGISIRKKTKHNTVYKP